MIQPYRALALMTFVALVGCGTLPPDETPPSQPIQFQLYNSPETTHVAAAISEKYREKFLDTQFTLETREVSSAASPPSATTGYFISHHLPAGSDIWAAPLAQDGLVLITHPENPVENLTPDEIRRLYQGIIVNWQEIGGNDSPVILFSREEDSSLRAEFERLVMGQRRISPNTRLIPSSAAALERVMALPGALAYIAFSQLQAGVKPLAIGDVLPTREAIADYFYPLRMTLFMIGQHEPTADEQPFVMWLQSPEGQAVIGQYYIPQIR